MIISSWSWTISHAMHRHTLAETTVLEQPLRKYLEILSSNLASPLNYIIIRGGNLKISCLRNSKNTVESKAPAQPLTTPRATVKWNALTAPYWPCCEIWITKPKQIGKVLMSHEMSLRDMHHITSSLAVAQS